MGCHGGLGGWQDRASHGLPGRLPFPEERIVGADAMHVALCAIPAALRAPEGRRVRRGFTPNGDSLVEIG